jgi:hypothetical protein
MDYKKDFEFSMNLAIEIIFIFEIIVVALKKSPLGFVS